MKMCAKLVSFMLACWAGGLFAASCWIMHDPNTFGPGGMGGQLLSKVAAPGVVGYYASGLSQVCLIMSLVCLAAAGLMKNTPSQIPYVFGGTEPPIRRFAKV
jgi:hypothetical protein